MSETTVDRRTASHFARIVLGHVSREYPNVVAHVMNTPADARAPSELHPVFFGSFDWHSSVHGHWLLARLLRIFPDLPEADAVRRRFDEAFTTDNVAGELAYLDAPNRGGFERPYGWAWLLMLAAELRRHGGAWDEAVRPMSELFAARMAAWLPKADYPVRAGVHSNTAFALALTHEYASSVGDPVLAELVRDKAHAWYAADADCQAWEPSGDDFISPTLIEAELMRRIQSTGAFRAWFAGFLPHAGGGHPASLFEPVRVSDRSDGKIAHLDGLNLSRAWCWRGVAAGLELGSPVRARALSAADHHFAASLSAVEGDYMGEHWLASFALLALLAPGG